MHLFSHGYRRASFPKGEALALPSGEGACEAGGRGRPPLWGGWCAAPGEVLGRVPAKQAGEVDTASDRTFTGPSFSVGKTFCDPLYRRADEQALGKADRRDPRPQRAHSSRMRIPESNRPPTPHGVGGPADSLNYLSYYPLQIRDSDQRRCSPWDPAQRRKRTAGSWCRKQSHRRCPRRRSQPDRRPDKPERKCPWPGSASEQ